MDSTALPPPQKYLIAQLVDLKDIDGLLNRAVECNKEGVQLYLPVRKLQMLVHLCLTKLNALKHAVTFRHGKCIWI